MFSLICVWINDWVKNREAGDLRRYRAHYDVIVMTCMNPCWLVANLPVWKIRLRKEMHLKYLLRNDSQFVQAMFMMTSSNGDIFHVTGHLWWEFTGPGEFPAQRPVTRAFDVFFDLRPNKRLSKQSWSWWFETPSRPLWRHRNASDSFHNSLGLWGHCYWTPKLHLFWNFLYISFEILILISSLISLIQLLISLCMSIFSFWYHWLYYWYC